MKIEKSQVKLKDCVNMPIKICGFCKEEIKLKDKDTILNYHRVLVKHWAGCQLYLNSLKTKAN